MVTNQKKSYSSIFLLIFSLSFLLQPLLSAEHGSNSYRVRFLVSDTLLLGGPTQDPRLVNPWGLVFTPRGNLLVANNGTDLATSYRPRGTILDFFFNAPGSPTGIVRNNCRESFLIDGVHPASYLIATESGTILAFNRRVNATDALPVIDRSAFNAVYKGIAIAEFEGDKFIFATDFHNGRIDVFDRNFQLVSSFTDPTIPAGYAPFNIRTFRNNLYVTYALNDGSDDDVPGAGNGFVNVFSTDGSLIRRLVSNGNLNAPWGLAIAPRNFGRFSRSLLVGNFGDGRINAYSLRDGTFLGQLEDEAGVPITISGLWSLSFREVGRGGRVGCDRSCGKRSRPRSVLYFTAGPNDETSGLIGIIQPRR